MRNMFARASAFNQPLSFDTSSVTSMAFMFEYSPFNQPLSFNLSSAKDLSYMFSRAAFEQSLSFLISSVTDTAIWGLFGVLSRNTACIKDGVEFSYTEAAELAGTLLMATSKSCRYSAHRQRSLRWSRE